MTPTEQVSVSLGMTRSSHRWREMPGNWDRLNTRALFESSNRWGIPDLPLPPTEQVPTGLVAYSDRRAIERAPAGSAVHFFLDDYRFETVWTKPERGLSRVGRVGLALTPDFSLWREMPLAMQLWQVYRSRWCGAWMLHHGVKVIPTISWSTSESFAFAFEGVARGSVVAISSVGVRDKEARALFLAGCEALAEEIAPSCVLSYGDALTEQVFASVRAYPTRWA